MLNFFRVAAVDDHPMFLEGLQKALRIAPQIKFVAQGATAMDARRIAHDVGPEVLLLDLGIPGGGLSALRHIAATLPHVNVIILTGSDDDEHVTSAIAAGAKGYVLKGARASDVVDAIQTVLEGRPYVCQPLASRLLVQRLQTDRREMPSQLDRLNHREKQVLECAAQGMTNRDIAEVLNLQVRTVKNYMSRVLQKLQARNRIAAIAALKRH